jgi:serine/threonine-protein phosphatase 6 regulatory ankyrin repeat subunit B
MDRLLWFCAVQEGQMQEIKELLLVNGDILRDVDESNERGETALQLAARRGHLSLVELLLEHGANPNREKPNHHHHQNEIGRRRATSTPLAEAAWEGHIAVCETLLAHGAHAHTVLDSRGTVLHLAAMRGNLQIVKLLLSTNDCNRQKTDTANIQHADVRNANHSTPFLEAVARQHLDVMKVLLDHGVDIHVQDKYGASALQLAAREGSVSLVTFLFNRGVTLTDSNATTLLRMAVEHSNTSLLECLFHHGAHQFVNEPVDIEGNTSLLLAIQRHRCKANVILQLFVRRDHPALLDQQRRFREPTPSSSSSSSSSLGDYSQVIQTLLQHGADANLVNGAGESPLYLAVCNRNHKRAFGHDLVILLLSHGADVQFRHPQHGDGPLHVVAQSGNVGLIKMLLLPPPFQKNGQQRAVDPNMTTILCQNTPLHIACRSGHQDVVQLLLEQGVAVNQANARGETPLHLAAAHRCLESVELLLRHGVDCSLVDKRGNLAVMTAAEQLESSVELLYQLLGAVVGAGFLS